ncbi:MAG: hypothetical protein WC374_11655 [Phycisphaerae bacterium]|jgi:hypothetical protein
MEIIKPDTTLTISLAFTDENGDAVTPSAARYRIDDVASGDEVLAWTNFTPATSTYDLIIEAAQNAIINSAQPTEKKLVKVEITYGTDNKKTDTYVYMVSDISDTYLSAIDDLVGGEVPLEDAEKIQALISAIKKYSGHRPYEVTEEVDGDGSFDYDLADLESWVDGFSVIKNVEYPVDDNDREDNSLQDDAWKIFKKSTGKYLRFLEDSPETGEQFRVTYTALHVCTNSLCTISASDETAVQMLAATNFCNMIAAYYAQTSDSVIQADSVDHKSKAAEYGARARTYKQEYCDHMGIKDGVVAAASVTRDQDAKPSWRGDGMTHPKRFR